MFRKEETKLEKWRTEIEQVNVTDDLLEKAIHQGFHRAKNIHPARRQRLYLKRGIWSLVVATILFLTLVTSIRVSPVMANAVASIPGMERFVDFIRDDKGLASAIENEYYQELNLSTEKKGVTLTLDGVIMDEQEMVVFYTVSRLKKDNYIEVGFPIVTNDNEKDPIIKGGSTSSSSLNFGEDDFEHTAKVNVHFSEGIQENDFVFEVIVNVDSKDINFEIPFSADKVKKPTTRYPVNQVATIEGQQIIIKQVEISPLKVAIHVGVDDANAKEILGFEDLRLVDDKDETWTSINNGITASGDPETDDMIYYLQSNYFEEAKELYLQFNKLMAIDKDEAFIIIDTESEKIIQQPKDMRFSNLTVNGKFINIKMRGEEGYHHHPFSTITDAVGEEFYISSSGFSGEYEGQIELSLELPDDTFENPIKLHFDGYPNYISGKAKIKIK